MDSPDARAGDTLARPLDDEDMTPGTVIAGRYEIRDVLGKGGMGTVYLAEDGEDVELGRLIAVKLLHAERSARASIARRFRAEACRAGSTGHPHIVQVFDAGALPDGRLFLVMEHLEGHNLAHELEEVLVFEVERACVLMRQVALALAAVHRDGIVHRDIKPSNVMLLSRAGGEVVKLLDFGLAAIVDPPAGAPERLAEDGAHASSADYMAPEQATRETPTPAVDVYAVGVMLYEMLTGALPFTARHTLELLTFKLIHPAPSIDARRPGLPPLLVRLIADCLSIDPAARPTDGAALVTRLDEVLAGKRDPLVMSAGDATMPIEAAPRRRRLATLWPVALTVGVVLAAGGVFVYASPDPPGGAAEILPPGPEPPRELHPRPITIPPGSPTPAIAPPPNQPEAKPEPSAEPDASSAPKQPRPPVPRAAPEPAPPASEEHRTARCERVRSRADEARHAQRWSQLRDQSRHRECWASDAEARKLQTKAAMELGDFSGCISLGAGMKDPEVKAWLRLCKMRVDE